MESLNIFKDYSKSKILDPFRCLYYTITICISEIYFGYTLIYLSAIDFSVVAKNFNIDFDLYVAQGIFQGIIPIGGAVGAISSTFFVSKLSRRQIIFLFNFVASILCLLSIYPDYRVLFFVRFFQGFCAGLFSAVVPMIVRQNAPIEMANIAGSCSNIFIIFGLFFLYFYAYILGLITGDMTGESSWKIIFLFPLFLMVVSSGLILWKFPFETTKYLAQNNKKQQLRNLITFFYKVEYVDQLCNEALKNYSTDQSKNEQARQVYHSKSALCYGIFYALLCPLVGINVMMSYCGDIAAKIFPSLKPVLGALLMLFFLTTSIVAIGYVSRHGRKQMTLLGTYGLAVTLYIMTFGYYIDTNSPGIAQIVIFASMILFLIVYGLTYAPIMWMWMAEVLQPTQIGYAVMINWSGAALIMILFPIVQQFVPNQGLIFAFFGTIAIISIPVTRKYMLQTKDKSDHQITEQYKELDKQQWGEPSQSNELEMNLMQVKK